MNKDITKNITLQQGDCLELMKDIEDASIDLILCDLPYQITACSWDSIIPFDKLWEEYKRIIKTNGAIVLFGAEPFSSHLRLSNLKNYKYDWIWVKNTQTGIALAKTQPMRKHEVVSVFCTGKHIYNKQETTSESAQVIKNEGKLRKGRNTPEHTGGMVCGGNVFKSSINPNSVLRFNVVNKALGTLHPTQKPVELCEYLIKTYTNEDMTVLDNCMGSGTTGVACINTNRKFIGMERDEGYFSIAKERIETALAARDEIVKISNYEKELHENN